MKSIVTTISDMRAYKIALADLYRPLPPTPRFTNLGCLCLIGCHAVAIALGLCFTKLFGIPFLKDLSFYASEELYGVRAIWAFQGKKAFYQSLDKYYQRKLGLPSQEIIPISLIDPREPLKQQLTGYETTIKKLCGEHFLYFKRNGPQEKFLILTAETDYNEAFKPCLLDAGLIYQLSKRFDVKYRVISCVEDIQREIQSATQFGRVMGLIIVAHGSCFSMTLSGNLNTGKLTNETISADLFAGLDPRCIIALRSCSTASDPDGIAYRVANIAKRTTFAKSDDSYGITLTNLEPLEFSFERPNCSVKTIKIEPPEE
ncbi:MAG TPA: hypothetical protein VFU89_05405 [Rhabdochlamydiaceae bacterium]|nr:hypothetical protein [Rhabdochlamydiaceae bacterium]